MFDVPLIPTINFKFGTLMAREKLPGREGNRPLVLLIRRAAGYGAEERDSPGDFQTTH